MKVFYIDPVSEGNLEIYDRSLLSNLSQDFDVTLMGNLHFHKEIPINGCKFETVFTYNDLGGVKKLISYLKSLWWIRKEIKRQKPDIVHIQWLKIPAFDVRFYLWIKRHYGVKIVFTAHNMLPHDSGSKYLKSFGRFYHGVDAVIVHDNNTKALLCSSFNVSDEKVNVIRHGILHYDLNEQLIEQELNDLKNKYRLSDDVLLFSILGNQNRYKGTDVLIDVWLSNKELRDNPKCALLIAGECKDFDLTEIQSVKNVIVENSHLSNERFFAMMKRTDVLLLPYRQISQSGVLLYAIDVRTPILVSDKGGLAEPLTIGNIGWKIKECDKKLLQERVMYVSANPGNVRQLKHENNTEWEKVQRAYSWCDIGVKTSILYRSLK